jgi:hypothetical protein
MPSLECVIMTVHRCKNGCSDCSGWRTTAENSCLEVLGGENFGRMSTELRKGGVFREMSG